MILNLSKYRNCISFVKYMIDRDQRNDICRTITETSIAIAVPTVAIAIFAKELYGENPLIDEMIKNLTDFYRYDSIIE